METTYVTCKSDNVEAYLNRWGWRDTDHNRRLWRAWQVEWCPDTIQFQLLVKTILLAAGERRGRRRRRGKIHQSLHGEQYNCKVITTIVAWYCLCNFQPSKYSTWSTFIHHSQLRNTSQWDACIYITYTWQRMERKVCATMARPELVRGNTFSSVISMRVECQCATT